jgi:DNA replicative helicase MCM subunit Mcm2 (Cdc46/Mcm family)
MVFYCKDCNNEFNVDDKKCEGYYNWKCPKCMHIAVKKDFNADFGIIWNCDTGTYRTNNKKENNCGNADKCSCCK